MPIATAVNVKQIVLAKGPFGPQEIQQIVEASGGRSGQLSGVAGSGQRDWRSERRPQPGRRRAAGRLLLSAGPLSARDRNAQDGRRRGAGPFLSGQDPLRPGALRRGDRELQCRGQGRLQRRRLRARPGPKRCAMPASPRRPCDVLDKLSGAVEQTAEYLYQRGATIAALRRQSAGSRRAVRAGRRGRSAAPRGAVRPGHGKRSPRQRRYGAGSVRAVGRAVSGPSSARC